MSVHFIFYFEREATGNRSICEIPEARIFRGTVRRLQFGCPLTGLTTHAADAGASPRTATYLVNGKGFGDPRQRG